MAHKLRQRGFSLIELMIALTLGLILVAGVMALFMATLKGNGDLARSQQLENELHASMGLIIRDLRRAGFDGKASPLPNFLNPFSLGTTGAYSGEAADSCVLFSYDLNNDGVLNTTSPGDERFGYRLKQGVVQLRSGGLGCAADGWTDITTATMVNVTQLLFNIDAITDDNIVINRITITLAGQLKNDAKVTRKLVGNVRVRNDIWAPHS